MTNIEIQDLLEAGADGGSLMGYWCKGHRNRADFAEACNAYSGAGRNAYDARYVRADEVSHVWWRCVPCGEGFHRYDHAEPGARGAFMATVAEPFLKRDRREWASYQRGLAYGYRSGLQWAIDRVDPITRDTLLKLWSRDAAKLTEGHPEIRP